MYVYTINIIGKHRVINLLVWKINFPIMQMRQKNTQ